MNIMYTGFQNTIISRRFPMRLPKRFPWLVLVLIWFYANTFGTANQKCLKSVYDVHREMYLVVKINERGLTELRLESFSVTH